MGNIKRNIHCFDVRIAKIAGIKAAIIYNDICFWTEKNIANETNFYDGRYWTFSTIKGFSKLYPYLTEKQIRDALDKLLLKNLIVSGNYNKSPYDRTKWYSPNEIPFAQKGKWKFQKGQINLPKKANQFDEKGEPIPYITTDYITDYNTLSAKKNFSEKNEEPKPKNEKKDPPFIPADPPLHNPPDINDVAHFFLRSGGTEEMAHKFFNKWSSFDWKDGYRTITNFRPLAINFIANYKQNEKQNEGSNSRNQGFSPKNGGFLWASKELKKIISNNTGLERPENEV